MSLTAQGYPACAHTACMYMRICIEAQLLVSTYLF